MIDVVIESFASQLNLYLKQRFSLPGDIVEVANLTEPDETVSSVVHNKIIVSLIKFEQDTTQTHTSGRPGAHGFRGSKSLPFILHLLVAGNFDTGLYSKALSYLSATAEYFYQNPVFDQSNAANLDPRIERYTVVSEALSLEDLSNLWGIFGGQHLPSVVYNLHLKVNNSH